MTQDNSNTEVTQEAQLLSCQVPGVTITQLGITTTRDDISRDEYNSLFRAVVSMSRCANWLLGDALNLADRQFGNKYTGSKYDEAAAATGLSRGTIRNIALTCKAIPIERRHPDLSFSHHRDAVMHSKNPDEQDYVLATASEQGQSVKDMRKSVRTRTVELLKKEDESLPPDAPAMDSKADPTGFHLLGLPEKASPDAPPRWDALEFIDWVNKQDVAGYDPDKCREAIRLTDDIAKFNAKVVARLAELEPPTA